MSRRYTPLPTRAQKAFEDLRPLIKSSEIVTCETAHEALIDAGFERGEVGDLLDILLQRGYLYSVHGELRITGPQ